MQKIQCMEYIHNIFCIHIAIAARRNLVIFSLSNCTVTVFVFCCKILYFTASFMLKVVSVLKNKGKWQFSRKCIHSILYFFLHKHVQNVDCLRYSYTVHQNKRKVPNFGQTGAACLIGGFDLSLVFLNVWLHL